jgi:pimeloyl-ACP methyl ester carboxylesterase
VLYRLKQCKPLGKTMSANTIKIGIIKPAVKKVGQMMWTAVSLFFVLMLIFAALLLSSPGKPAPVLDERGNPVPGSISEKVFVEINGVRQGMFIKSKDPSNPVLLYLHGGMPDHFLSKKYPTGLEELFTVVWWEQRGSGMSYHADLPPETMTLEQLIADTIEVTHYLRQRFGKEKIYLMGHSGGTFIGILAAAEAPDLYHAYIGQAQMSYQLKSEKLAYDYMLQQYRIDDNTEKVKKLKEYTQLLFHQAYTNWYEYPGRF